ncbi:MAG: hypothetical protein AAFV25_02645, partial [Bacteroidota bacterium]
LQGIQVFEGVWEFCLRGNAFRHLIHDVLYGVNPQPPSLVFEKRNFGKLCFSIGPADDTGGAVG